MQIMTHQHVSVRIVGMTYWQTKYSVMEAPTELFITLIEVNRIIYDKSSNDFKNVRKKDEAWERVARNSHMTGKIKKKKRIFVLLIK